jgi:hypothetical protein
MEESYSHNEWFRIGTDPSNLPLFLEYFYKQYEIARKRLEIKGSLERAAKEISLEVELRFSQLQVINAVVRHYEIEEEKLRAAAFRKYMENYNRSLSSRDAEKYSAGEDDVVALQHIINEVVLLRNLFVSLTKALETKHFQITNVIKLRVAGIELGGVEV